MFPANAVRPSFNAGEASSPVRFGRAADPSEYDQIRDFLSAKGLEGDKVDPNLTKVQDRTSFLSKIRNHSEERRETKELMSAVKQKSKQDPHPWTANLYKLKNQAAADRSWAIYQRILPMLLVILEKLYGKQALDEVLAEMECKQLFLKPAPNQILLVLAPKEPSDKSLFEFIG
ncbi:MAG TPA: hypothetical protein V6C52_07230 [Coleofasciculaceae cyanobacterium]|jgi:hypothetical protein